MSFHFRDSPKLSDRLRGMSDAELRETLKQKFNIDDDPFFEPRSSRDSFERPFSHFPRGFPFNDTDIFEHPRGDGIRAHLDDLASRHPELAEHLRGPPWPFGNSLLRDRRRRRRGSGGNDNDSQQQQGHQVDEDARSQASGSSAASGASAVSSHSSGEPDLTSSIPQYGLRNTVDIGQQQRRRDMETSPEKGERGQRSMSAPPENRQQQGQNYPQQQQQQPQPSQGQRFVSRVDITPQHNQQRSQSPSKPPSNVRHIPIFVEGRDEPVMSKLATDDTPSSAFPQRQPSPPRHFHRPSHFNEHYSRQQWPPSRFQNAFYEPAGFEQPMRRNQQFQQHQPPQYQQPPYHQQQQQQPQHPQYNHQQYSQQSPQQQQPQPQYYQQPLQQQQQQQPQQQQQQQQEIPKPKPPMPKDPLERVALVQKEVDNLAEQVQRYIGGSRQDKEYIYLDEMLTRELIKLDDIETEGRENVRQARKNTIKSIQDTISLLETKAPLSEQQPAPSEEEKEENSAKDSESMDVDAKQEKQSGEPIPLPPASSSSTKTKVESSESTAAAESANQNIVPAVQRNTELPDMDVEQKIDNCSAENTEQPVTATSTDNTTKLTDEMSKESKPSDSEQRNDGSEATTIENKDTQVEEAKKEKIETNGGQQNSTESPRLQKKVKKTSKKEQQPVSEQAIPLPPPPPPLPAENTK